MVIVNFVLVEKKSVKQLLFFVHHVVILLN